MGNAACSCAQRRHQSVSDPFQISKKDLEMFNKAQTTTPYDNGSIHFLSMDDKFSLETDESQNEMAIETPIITQKFQNQYKLPNKNPSPPVYFRSNLTSNTDTKRTTSVFSSDGLSEEGDFQRNNNLELYDIILREFLINNYPINNDIIEEMISINLLLPEDAETLLSCESNKEKSFSFLNQFVFTEINICKLATFLHVLITKKSHILYIFKKTDKFFQSIVDHIYYVVNFLSLLEDYSKIENKLRNIKILSSIISVNSIKVENSEDVFYIQIYMNGFIFPGRFWKDFACINEYFHCCREIRLSSCNLQPNDIKILVKGFTVKNILQNLDVSSNPITDEGLKYMEDFFLDQNYLVSVNIACCSLTNIGVEEFLETIIEGNNNIYLKKLNISHNDLNNMTEKSLLILGKLNLYSLEMKSINLRNQKSFFQSLKQNNSLRKIDFSGNKLQTNDVTYLAAWLAYEVKLTSLSLAMTGILKSDCFTINNTLLMNKSLVTIDLSDNLIGDEGAERLKDIFTMKKTLKDIYLRRCGISLQGILNLLRKVSETECNLKLLDLCYNHSPRLSIVVDVKDILRKIEDVRYHISLVKNMRILLWGTIDDEIISSSYSIA